MKNLIGKNWMDASDGKVIEVTNPATNEFIDTVPNSSLDDVDMAVKEAIIGQKVWAKVPIHERGKILMKFNELVKSHRDELAKLLSDETGKPITEAYGEIDNVDIGVPAFVEKAKHEYGHLIPRGSEKGNERTIQYTVQEPLGVVAAIIPFNFPSDLFCQKVPSALMMGNAVIVKPSTYNPLTLTRYVELLIEAGVPYGAIEVLHGDGKTVGQGLAAHKGVALVSLTGSTAAGMETMGTCSKNLTHVMLELGGNDALIIHKDADMDLAVEETVWGRLYNTGQVCCASKRFLVHNSVKDEFIRRMIEKIQSLKIGMPSDPDTKIGCLINENAAIRVDEQVKQTVSQGANIVYGGRRNGAFFEPTILDNVTKDMDVAKDMEIFGPVISVIGYDDIDDAIAIANQSSFGLCGGIITNDMPLAMNVSEKMECGGFIVNGASFFRSFEMPFGGWKHSGIGNEGVSSTLKEMSRTKTVILKNIIK